MSYLSFFTQTLFLIFFPFLSVLFLLVLLLGKKPREEINVDCCTLFAKKKKQNKKHSIAVFLFTETNAQGSDYLRELSLRCHIRLSKYFLFLFMLKGLNHHRR